MGEEQVLVKTRFKRKRERKDFWKNDLSFLAKKNKKQTTASIDCRERETLQHDAVYYASGEWRERGREGGRDKKKTLEKMYGTSSFARRPAPECLEQAPD